MKTFEISGHTYIQDMLGIVHQVNAEPFTYDKDYIACYDSPEYVRNSFKLQHIRYDFIVKELTSAPSNYRFLDYGFGNGHFLMHVQSSAGLAPMGYDIGDYEIPLGCEKWDGKKSFDILTMWDVLEHIPDLQDFFNTVISKFWPTYICISLPKPPLEYDESGERNFLPWEDWHHLKPNEHLHHFKPSALVGLMDAWGYTSVRQGSPEDAVRRPKQGQAYNIFTGLYKIRR